MSRTPGRTVISANQYVTRVKFSDFVLGPDLYMRDLSDGKRVVIHNADGQSIATFMGPQPSPDSHVDLHHCD